MRASTLTRALGAEDFNIDLSVILGRRWNEDQFEPRELHRMLEVFTSQEENDSSGCSRVQTENTV